jgi:hypothetical protein
VSLWAQQAGVRFVVEMPERLQEQVLRGHFMMGFLTGALLVLAALVISKRIREDAEQ